MAGRILSKYLSFRAKREIPIITGSLDKFGMTYFEMRHLPAVFCTLITIRAEDARRFFTIVLQNVPDGEKTPTRLQGKGGERPRHSAKPRRELLYPG